MMMIEGRACRALVLTCTLALTACDTATGNQAAVTPTSDAQTTETTRTGVGDAGGASPLACSLWPHALQQWPEQPYTDDCLSLDGIERYRCGEYWFWEGLSHDVGFRPTSMATLSAIIDADSGEDTQGLARMYALRGQLGLALLVEHSDFSALQQTQTDMAKVAELDPNNPTIPTFLDSIELVFAFRTGDQARMTELWDEIWGNVESCPLGNLLSISGTSIGLPLNTGWPTETADRLRAWECTDAGFCGANTWKAPYVRPGLAFHFAEAFARVGDKAEAQRYLDAAIVAPGFDAWPFATFVSKTRDDLDGWMSDFASLGQDGDATNMVYANQEFGCIFCHSTDPPADMVRTERLGLADLDPPTDPPTDPATDPPTGDGACTNEADLGVITGSEDISATMSSCAFECLSQGDSCLDTCIGDATGLSVTCTECFTTMVNCTMANCALICLDPNSASCAECQEKHCIPPFTDCAGMSPP